jgi:hypothetical protein
MLNKIKLLRIALVFAFSISETVSVAVQAATTESAVKAGFIYNFSKFIEWPDSTSVYAKFNLCVVGDNRLEDSLQALEGRMVGNKPLSLHNNATGESLKSCQMLFIADDSDQTTYALLRELGNAPVVTVSDSPEFILKGGMIGLIHDGSRINFEVNLASANAAGVHLSAQLLKLAKSVKGLK